MNRLSYGAAGLLLALSLTAIISSTSADSVQHPDIDKYVNSGNPDDKDVKRGSAKVKFYKTHNSDRAKLLLGETIKDVLEYNDAEKREYLLHISKYLTSHGVFGKEKDCKKEKEKDLQSKCLTDDKIEKSMTSKVLARKNGKALDIFVKYFYSVAYGYLHKLQEGIQDGGSEGKYNAALDALKADGIITATQHGKHTDYHTRNKTAYEDILKENGYNDHVDKEEAYQNLHFKPHMTSRKQWDKAYKALPAIEKYDANGLNPIRKDRLYSALKVAFTKDENQSAYDKAKKTSAMHLKAIANEAKYEAVSSSDTSASRYLRNDPYYNELYKTFHNHDELGPPNGHLG